jgi:hypothetical protein
VHEGEFSVFSKNRIAPLANGIHVKSKQERKRVADCLESNAHQAAIEAAELLEQQSDRHMRG